MSFDENAYREAVDRMTLEQKFQRVEELIRIGRSGVMMQIQREKGEMSPERMKWEILLRLYGKSSQLRGLIEEELARISA